MLINIPSLLFFRCFSVRARILVGHSKYHQKWMLKLNPPAAWRQLFPHPVPWRCLGIMWPIGRSMLTHSDSKALMMRFSSLKSVWLNGKLSLLLCTSLAELERANNSCCCFLLCNLSSNLCRVYAPSFIHWTFAALRIWRKSTRVWLRFALATPNAYVMEVYKCYRK